MLKFLNRSSKGEERMFRVSITSVQGGAMMDVSMEDGLGSKDVGILLTPMDAALMIEEIEMSRGISFSAVGHGCDGSDVRAYSIIGVSTEWYCVGAVSESCIEAGGLKMIVPRFVVKAIGMALAGMMASLMYPTTGDMEEEFG